MPIETEEDRAVFFNAAEFGVAAVYTPPGGGGTTSCTLLMGLQDRTAVAVRGRPILQGIEASVRRTELASPAKGGTLAVEGVTYTIESDPRHDDEARQIWTFTLRPTT